MNKVSNIIKYAVLAAVTLIFIFPLVWVFYNSFKTNSELTEMEIIECCYDDFFGGDDDTHSFHFNTAVFNVFKGGDH